MGGDGLTVLARGSPYVMRDSVRYNFTHEVLGADCSKFRDQRVVRDRRVSIICRCLPPSPPTSWQFLDLICDRSCTHDWFKICCLRTDPGFPASWRILDLLHHDRFRISCLMTDSGSPATSLIFPFLSRDRPWVSIPVTGPVYPASLQNWYLLPHYKTGISCLVIDAESPASW